MPRLARALVSGALAVCTAAYTGVLPAWRQFNNKEETSASARVQSTLRDGENGVYATLLSVATDETRSETEREVARQILRDTLEQERLENAVEEELWLRGFGKSTAYIQSGCVSLVIQTEIKEEDIPAVFEAVARITGCKTGEIRIIPAAAP